MIKNTLVRLCYNGCCYSSWLLLRIPQLYAFLNLSHHVEYRQNNCRVKRRTEKREEVLNI